MSSRIPALVLFALCLAFYLATAARDVYWFDSPELTAAAVNLDIAHPPGYPLWTMLGHAFTLLPVGPVPLRVAAFSATAAAAAVALFFGFLQATGLKRPAACAGACALAFLPQFWDLAVIQEVYALEMALLMALLWSLAPDAGGKPMPRVAFSGFLAGCLVAHRPSDALFLPFFLGLAKLPRAASFLVLLVSQFGILALALALAGLATAVARRRPEMVTILGIALANAVFCANHNAIETNTMILPLLAMVCWLMALGADALLRVVESPAQVAAAAAIVLLPLSWVPGSYRACDRSGFHEVSRYLEDLYRILPRRARLVTTTDVDAFSVLYGRFCLRERPDLELTILERWDPAVEASIRAALARGRPVFGSLLLPADGFERASTAFRLRRQGFLYRLEPPERDAAPAAPRPPQAASQADPGAVVEVAAGVRLDRRSLSARLEVRPGLCSVGASWELSAVRGCRRPGAVLALFAGERLAHCWIEPVGGVATPPVAGRCDDVYRLRLPASVGPGRYELSAGLVDLDLVEREIQPGGAAGAIESFDPARIEGLERWKDRDLRFVAAIRECVPYRTATLRVRDPGRFLARPGLRLYSCGAVRVELPPRGGR
ncbi:MAG: DUF2723 domain-containing protein [Candidatus Wallbacteria bacterium]|nr:DUF2723 domain-containing protein [Candidatus Wallbacteria bacterium]